MICRYERANAALGHPIALRRVTRTNTGEITEMVPQCWHIHASPIAKGKPLYTAPAEKIHRLRRGVYEVVIPAGILTKPGVYHDSLVAETLPCHWDHFTLHEQAPPIVGYASIAQVRHEDAQLADTKGFPDEAVNDAIAAASLLMERWTGRWFVPRRQTLSLDGASTYLLPLPQPLLHLEGIQPFSILLNGWLQEPWELKNVAAAADWDNPRLEGPFFPRGRRNILLKGLFGTVDDEAAIPAAIAKATARLAARDLLRGSSSGPDTAAGPVVSEHTDGHSYQLAVSTAAQEACYSGDPAIDTVVAAHKRPLVTGNAL